MTPEQAYAVLFAYAASAGLIPSIARLYANLSVYFWQYGYPYPSIKSGFRSGLYQAHLQARWDAGDRTGLAVRPATKSMHTQGRAYDIDPAYSYVNDWGSIWELIGGRWGGNFKTPDPYHLDM